MTGSEVRFRERSRPVALNVSLPDFDPGAGIYGRVPSARCMVC